MDAKGGCSPQNNLENCGLVIEVRAGGNNNFAQVAEKEQTFAIKPRDNR